MSEHIKNKDLHDPRVCEMIIDYVQSMQIPAAFDPMPIQSQEDLEYIKQSDYLVMPVYEGTPIWCCWFQKGDVYYATVFPKYFKNNVYNAKVYPIKMAFTKRFYNGTVMEGTFHQEMNVSTLVITDVHYLAGQRMVTMSRETRLNQALMTFQNGSTVLDDNYRLTVTRCYHVNHFSLTNLFEKIRDNDNIKQLRFCPNNAGTKIYEYTLAQEDKIERIIRKGTFDMQRVGSDVYHLYYLDSNDRIGIAYIPDIHVSKMCAAWFKKQKKVRVNCVYDPVVKKYTPAELVE